ncbi:MAG: adenylate/guanylate cyclase domain-containing protein [Pseudohongiellaceae bacterium]
MAGGSNIAASLRGLLESRRLIYLLGVLVTLLVLLVHTAAPPFISYLTQRMDYMIYDLRYAAMPRPERADDYNIVIVDIDERSLQAEGQWPWDRLKLAELTRQLEQQGALLTAYDITFPEPQRNPFRDLLEQSGLPEELDFLSGSLDVLIDEFSADSEFADALASPAMDTVLALSFSPVEDAEYGALPESIVDIETSMAQRLRLPTMAGYTNNIPVLQEAAQGAGLMNQMPDPDGVVRRIPLVVRYGDALYPTLALEMARAYFFEERFSLITYESGGSVSVDGVRMGQRGQYVVPTDSRAQVLVPFVGRSGLSGESPYTYVSATDVLHGEVPEGTLDNALVLVGTTATGLFDLRATPLESVFPGVEVHANVLNGLLKSFESLEVGQDGQVIDNDGETPPAFPYKPVWEPGAMAVGLVVMGVALSLLLPMLGPALLTLASLLIVGGLIWGNFWLWGSQRLDLSLTLPVVLVLLLMGLNLVWGFLRERRTRQTIKGMFDQYVPPAHIDAMLRDPDLYSFAGVNRELTVLFSDIRNFTAISESLSATELKTLLNEFFTPVTGIIFDHQGTIDKYVGDMVMAFWGAPLKDDDHAEHAVQAALVMLAIVEELKPRFEREGLPEINIGVGINTGPMNVGDMGSEYRRSYTVLGDAVNLGSRLEGLTKFYGVGCLIGEKTFEELQNIVCREVDRVRVKGKTVPITIREPVCHREALTEEIEGELAQWHQALDAYYRQDWARARQHIEALQQAYPGRQLYPLFLSRIETLQDSGLPADWDGVYRHESK